MLYCIWIWLILFNHSFTVNASNITEEACDKYRTLCFQVPKFTPTSECSCSVYGFNGQFCADFLYLEDNVEEEPLSFEYVIDNTTVSRNGSMLSRALRFFALYSQCQQINKEHEISPYTVINSCPKSWSDEQISRQCIDPTSRLPPIDYKGYISFVFKNIFCALCHGLSEQFITSDMIVWKSHFTCDNVPEENIGRSVLDKVKCNLRYEIPRLAHLSVDTMKQNCIDMINFECILCLDEIQNGRNKSSLNCVVCRYAVIGYTAYFDMSLPYDMLSILFKMPSQEENKIFINGNIFKSSQLCSQDNETYDLLFQRCRTFVCADGQFALEGRCQVETNVFVSPDSQIYPSNYTSVNVIVTFEDRDINLMFEIILKMFNDEESNMPPFSTKNNIYKQTQFHVQSHLPITEILNKWSEMALHTDDSIYFHLDLNNINKTAKNSSCGLDNFLCIPDPDTFFLNSKPFARVESSGKSYMYPLDNIMYNITIDRINSSFVIHEVCVCEQIVEDVRGNINCSGPLYEYTTDEYRLLHNYHLELVKENLQFNQSQYLIRNNTALVCYDRVSLRDLHFFQFDEIQGYVSLTCKSISIIFLILSIILFIMFKELRNLPGRLTAGLSVFLIIAQSMLLLPNLERSVCKYVASITHFSWLSVFFWMSCIAANTIITFHPKLMLSRISWRVKSVFWRYCALAVGIPAIICVLFLILDVTEGNHYHIRYGEVNCNWIGDRYGFIFVFFLPVAITITFNIICFCITLYNIERSLKTSEDVTGHKRDKSRCHMYIRLSSVMGFSWIFGFVAVMLKLNLLWYGFIIFNGLQGLFIFLSFSVNARTQTLLTKWFSGTFSSLFKSSYENHSNRSLRK